MESRPSSERVDPVAGLGLDEMGNKELNATEQGSAERAGSNFLPYNSLRRTGVCVFI